jgi:hypothetical protein
MLWTDCWPTGRLAQAGTNGMVGNFNKRIKNNALKYLFQSIFEMKKK